MKATIEHLAEMRWRACGVIAQQAQDAGLDVTQQKVNRRYNVWCEWYAGRLETGYVMRMTGVRFIRRDGQ